MLDPIQPSCGIFLKSLSLMTTCHLYWAHFQLWESSYRGLSPRWSKTHFWTPRHSHTATTPLHGMVDIGQRAFSIVSCVTCIFLLIESRSDISPMTIDGNFNPLPLETYQVEALPDCCDLDPIMDLKVPSPDLPQPDIAFPLLPSPDYDISKESLSPKGERTICHDLIPHSTHPLLSLLLSLMSSPPPPPTPQTLFQGMRSFILEPNEYLLRSRGEVVSLSPSPTDSRDPGLHNFVKLNDVGRIPENIYTGTHPHTDTPTYHTYTLPPPHSHFLCPLRCEQ